MSAAAENIGVDDARPWPLVLMIGLGAWLAAIPLFVVIVLLFGDTILKGASAFVAGFALLAAAIFNFRRPTLSIFVEQLGLPVLMVGGGLIGAGLFDSSSDDTSCAILAAITCGTAMLIPRHWLRVLLGAIACALLLAAFAMDHHHDAIDFWTALHVALALWLAANSLRRRAFADGAAFIEAFGAGWVLALLAGLAAWSGMTFMLGATVDLPGGMLGHHAWTPISTAMAITSAILAICAAAWVAHRWPSLRVWWMLPFGVVLAGMAWLNSTLGASLLIVALSASAQRWRIASAAGVAAAWIIGAFYYQLSVPLATKAIVMIGAGAVFGAIAWSARRPALRESGAAPLAHQRAATVGILLSALAVLVVVNTGIWQKERLLSSSRVFFVALAPVDPRSLMQGDYMRLNFNLPPQRVEEAWDTAPDTTRQVVATVDARGIASLPRYYSGERLADGEFLIDLVRRGGRWTMVSDAWQFKEGEAERWAKARYGEFKVDGKGHVLLVGLRGPALEQL